MDVEKSYINSKLVTVNAELPENVYLDIIRVYNTIYLNPVDPIYNRHVPGLEFFLGYLIANGIKYFFDNKDELEL